MRHTARREHVHCLSPPPPWDSSDEDRPIWCYFFWRDAYGWDREDDGVGTSAQHEHEHEHEGHEAEDMSEDSGVEQEF